MEEDSRQRERMNSRRGMKQAVESANHLWELLPGVGEDGHTGKAGKLEEARSESCVPGWGTQTLFHPSGVGKLYNRHWMVNTVFEALNSAVVLQKQPQCVNKWAWLSLTEAGCRMSLPSRYR